MASARTLFQTCIVFVLYVLPRAALSRAWGRLARLRRPIWLRRWLQRAFVRLAGVQMAEAERPIDHYGTLQELFTRRLGPGARPICEAEDALISPVDATLGASGVVCDGTLLQVKGKTYALAALLAIPPAEAQRFEGGAYVTLYLSPRDYHRIHSPVNGSVARVRIIPGALFAVFEQSVRLVRELFARNERVVVDLDEENGTRVALALVGAMNVGSIGLVFEPSVRTNRPGRRRQDQLTFDPPVHLARGAELAVFEMGSTVVVVTERAGAWVLADAAQAAGRVRMGEVLMRKPPCGA